MPITKSAKKALRSSLRKRGFNLKRKAMITDAKRSISKSLNKDVKDKAELNKLIAAYYSSLDKAVKTNYISKAKANRLKSRVQIRVSKVLGEYKPEFAEIVKEKSEKKAKPGKKVEEKTVAKKSVKKTSSNKE